MDLIYASFPFLFSKLIPFTDFSRQLYCFKVFFFLFSLSRISPSSLCTLGSNKKYFWKYFQAYVRSVWVETVFSLKFSWPIVIFYIRPLSLSLFIPAPILLEILLFFFFMNSLSFFHSRLCSFYFYIPFFQQNSLLIYSS